MQKIKILVVLLALLQPIIIIAVFGLEFKSFSKIYGTILEPLFVITNATTSFFFFSLERWKLPAILLLFLTAFSTGVYHTTHNILAVLFFISCANALLEYKRRRIYFFLYCSSVFFFTCGILWFEFFATWVLCLYHLESIWVLYKFKNRTDGYE